MKKLLTAVVTLALAVGVFAGGMEMTSARLYKKQGEWLKSLEFYNSELQKNPTNADAYFERGEMLGEIAMDASKAGMAKEIAGDSGNAQRALLERMLSDFEKAKANSDEKSLKKLKKNIDRIVDDAWGTFYGAAVREDSAGAFDKAIEQTDIAILLMPHDWRAYGVKAQVLDKQDKPAEALIVWEQAYQYLTQSDMSKEKPEDYQRAMDVIRGRLLEGYYNSGAYPQTIKMADEVLKIDPSSVDAIQFKAFALAQMASDTSFTVAQRDSFRTVAVNALAKAQEVRPDYAPIVYTKGQFCLQLGDTTCAMSSFAEYLKLEPGDRDALFITGVIYLEGGSFANTEKARDTFRTLTETHPEDSAGWINYGVALIRLGDNENGRKAVEKGKELSGSK